MAIKVTSPVYNVMRTADFSFEIPKSLIAYYPMQERSSCRLLSLDGRTGAMAHGAFIDLIDKLNPGDLLVFNNTRVIPARLFGCKASGGKIEMLVERMLDDKRILAHIRASKALKHGVELLLGNDRNIKATIMSCRSALFEVEFDGKCTVLDILNGIGHIPLPPYIERLDNKADRELYQTVYSQKLGAIAAPTAGLHFDEFLLEKLRQKGVEMTFITLHIGAGTFQPVRVDRIEDHVMHSEYIEVSQDVIDAVLAAKARNNRVIAVGTTSVRSLESAAQAAKTGLIEPFFGDTQIFIYPGYQYKVIDALITNFHLPRSTLVMLVSAFAGHQYTMNAYKLAVEQKYRFFSYGDAMFITYNPQVLDKSAGE